MGLFDDLFGSSGVAYPAGRAGTQSAPRTTTTAQRDGFFEKLFAPQELAYPVPVAPSLGRASTRSNSTIG